MNERRFICGVAEMLRRDQRRANAVRPRAETSAMTKQLQAIGREAERFNDSLEQCTRHPGFFERFYDLFTDSSTEVAKKFARTDHVKHRRMLRASLYMMLSAVSGGTDGPAHLGRIAQRHSRVGLDIPPEMYDLWLECMIRAAREFDPSFTTETERAWRMVLGCGIEFMKSRY